MEIWLDILLPNINLTIVLPCFTYIIHDSVGCDALLLNCLLLSKKLSCPHQCFILRTNLMTMCNSVLSADSERSFSPTENNRLQLERPLLNTRYMPLAQDHTADSVGASCWWATDLWAHCLGFSWPTNCYGPCSRWTMQMFLAKKKKLQLKSKLSSHFNPDNLGRVKYWILI